MNAMQKVMFIEGYNEDNAALDEMNELLEDGWYVETVTAAPASDGGNPVFAFVLTDE